MKVLHITPTFFPVIGGIETVVRDLALYLRRHGVVADVMQVSPHNKERRKEHLDESDVFRVPLFPNRLVESPRRSGLCLRAMICCNVHDPQIMALSANVLLQGRGKKKVLSTHGGFFHTASYSSIKKLHWQFFASTILKQYDAVLASSSGDHDTFRSKLPTVKLLPNGVNVSKFLSVERSGDLSATRWIYWGRMSGHKRIDLLIDTVRQARNSGHDVTLTIAGEDCDGLVPSVRAKIADYGLKERIRILGLLSDSDLLAELAGHAVFITASEYEGFGLSVIEAMAAGLIVICRDMAPLDSFVVPRENGITIGFDRSAGDVAKLASLCAAPPKEVRAMQDFARASSMSHGWDTVIKKYIAVYEDVLRHGA